MQLWLAIFAVAQVSHYTSPPSLPGAHSGRDRAHSYSPWLHKHELSPPQEAPIEYPGAPPWEPAVGSFAKIPLSAAAEVAWTRHAGAAVRKFSAAATIGGYLAKCHGPAEQQSKALKIASGMGRDGNHMHQIVNAIEMALAGGVPAVELWREWSEDSAEQQLLNDSVWMFPQRITLKTRLKGPQLCKRFFSEAGFYDCTYAFFSWCVSDVATRRAIYLEDILPHMNPEVAQICEPPGEDELVIHLRSGDVARETEGEHRQPPCSYFDHVLNTGYVNGSSFRRAHLVYAPGAPSPCIEYLETKYADKVMSGTSKTKGGKENDVCLLSQAINLAMTASAFGITLGLMNTRLRRVFTVDTAASQWQSNSLAARQAPRRVRIYFLDAHEMCAVYESVAAYRVAEDDSLAMRTCDDATWRAVPGLPGLDRWGYALGPDGAPRDHPWAKHG